MKVCNMCRSQLPDTYTACPNCGNTNLVIDQSSVQPQAGVPNQGQPMGNYQQPMGYQQPMPGPGVQPVNNEKGSIGWGILGFIIPIVGWILYFCWKNTKPGNAKMAGIGGIAGFVFNLIIQFVL